VTTPTTRLIGLAVIAACAGGLSGGEMRLAKDPADAARLLAACGAESLPFMLLADDKHVVTALAVQPDDLGRLGDIPPSPEDPTTRPADAAAGGDK